MQDQPRPQVADDLLGAADLLSRDEIRALTRSSNIAGALSIAWTWLVIAASFAALAVWPHPLVFAVAAVILGGRQLALAVLMHEAAHGTLFRARWANEHLVDWLCARLVWSDTARYRRHHLQHHGHTGTERDPDLGLALAGPMTRSSLTRKIARDLFGATGVRRVVGLGDRLFRARRSTTGDQEIQCGDQRRTLCRKRAHHLAERCLGNGDQ